MKNFQKIIGKLIFFLNDSRVVRMLGNMSGENIKNVVPGSDLTERIFLGWGEYSSKYALCVIGASDQDIAAIKDRYAVADIYHYNPPFGFIEDEAEIGKCVEYCKALPPCIFFVSVGSPRQEILSDKLRAAGVEGVFLCVGASVLFLSGSERRAPKVIQNLCLEWLFRLLQSPRRLWRRYLIDGPYIFWLLIKGSK